MKLILLALKLKKGYNLLCLNTIIYNGKLINVDLKDDLVWEILLRNYLELMREF